LYLKQLTTNNVWRFDLQTLPPNINILNIMNSQFLHKKISTLKGTVILIIVSSIFIFFIYKYSQIPEVIGPIKIKIQEKVEKDETVNWKTYRNEEYGYEIKYPLLWKSPIEGWAPGWTVGKSIDNNYCIIDVLSLPASKGANEAEIANLLERGYIQTSLKMGGIDSIRLTRQPAGAGLTEAVYFSYNGNNFRIGRNRSPGDEIENECINVFNRVLSTFRFLE